MELLLFILSQGLPVRLPESPSKEEKAPVAEWITKPIPHWSCAAPYIVIDDIPPPVRPDCFLVPQKLHFQFDLKKNEQIFLKRKEKVRDDGLLRIDFGVGFISVPACKIAGDEKDHIEWLENEKDHFLFKGKPGQELSFDCRGFIPRRPQ